MGPVLHRCIPKYHSVFVNPPVLGAMLYQEHSEGLRPVAFASRKLSSPEQRYVINQLEFFLLKCAVVDKFYDYPYHAKFTMRTDNNPLTCVLITARMNPTGHRWLAALATYDFTFSTSQESLILMQTCCPAT